MKQNEVREYYNEFIPYQKKSRVNERIYSLYRRMKGYGLRSDSKILELGCGIGVLTYLLSKKVGVNGLIEAVDLSDKSVEYASSKIRKGNVSFTAHDVVDYQPNGENFDFITLFDVIEHIPIERHNALFANLAKIATDKTLILINIPNPDSLAYAAMHTPELLQIIDQPVYNDVMVENTESNGLQIEFLETYSIWKENDYRFFAIRKKQDFVPCDLNAKRSFWQKVMNKLRYLYISKRYRYS